jgi:hypothetical protein
VAIANKAIHGAAVLDIVNGALIVFVVCITVPLNGNCIMPKRRRIRVNGKRQIEVIVKCASTNLLKF